MEIVVCIKQVPASSNVKVDPETGVLIRDGVNSKMNPYDLYALETALRLKETYGGTVQVISMGPPAATAILKEAIYMGADKGTLISDRRLGGADVLATAYTLSSAIRALGKVDLILCGKQTTDGDTAQVGSELAEYLGLPQYSNVRTIQNENDTVHVVTELGSTILSAAIKLPCVLCMDSEVNTPRLPSYKRKKQMDLEMDKRIFVLSLDDFEDRNPKHYGLSGSATQVEKIFPPEKMDQHMVFTGQAKDVSKQVFDLLKQKKVLE